MLLRPRAACGRRQGVRPTSHLQGTFRAHVEGGSGRSEASPTAILQDTHSVEVEFSEGSLKSKDRDFLRSRPRISAMLGMRVNWMTRRQVGCLAIS